MTGSASTKALDAALFQVRFGIIPPSKDGYNKFFGNKYQTLDAIEWAVRGKEYENGILRTFQIDSHPTDSGHSVLSMMVVHVDSGEWKSWGMPMPTMMIVGTAKLGNEREIAIQPQEMGKAITYNKRYMLKAFYGIPDEDDDGEGAYQRPNQAVRNQAESAIAPTPNLTIDMIIMDLKKCKDEAAVKELVEKYRKFISTSHSDGKATFKKAYEFKMGEFQHIQEGAN